MTPRRRRRIPAAYQKMTKEELMSALNKKELELESFKDNVIEVTNEYPAGCEAGKRDFLRKLELGPKVPLAGRYEVTLVLDIQEDFIDEQYSVNENSWGSEEEFVEFLHRECAEWDSYENLIQNYSGINWSIDRVSGPNTHY